MGGAAGWSTPEPLPVGRGLSVQIIGGRGETSSTSRMAHRTMAANGFLPPSASSIMPWQRAVAGRRCFHRRRCVQHLGSKPVSDATDEQVADAVASGKFHIPGRTACFRYAGRRASRSSSTSRSRAARRRSFKDCLEDLNEGVRYVVVGTHSRMIEGSIIETMCGAGWILEIERPCIFTIDQDGRQTIIVDGVQGW